MFLHVQKPLSWQCLQLLCEVSSLELALGEGPHLDLGKQQLSLGLF